MNKSYILKKSIPACLLVMFFTSTGLHGCKPAQTEPTQNNLSNSSWATLVYGLGVENIVCCVETHYNFFDGDSVFNGNTYKKLYCYKDKQHSARFYEGLVRENNSKIFFVQKDTDTEYLLYDFSVTEGTTFEYINYKYSEEKINIFVNNVDYVHINGNNVKRIQLSFPMDTENIIDIWYEGIGSVNGFLYPILQLDGGGRILLCYCQKDTFTYQNPQFPSCYYDSAEEVENLLHSNTQQQ